MKLRWTRLAMADFKHAHGHIAQDNSESVRQIAQRILNATETLLTYPRIGGISENEDSREWLVEKTPYLLVHTIYPAKA